MKSQTTSPDRYCISRARTHTHTHTHVSHAFNLKWQYTSALLAFSTTLITALFRTQTWAEATGVTIRMQIKYLQAEGVSVYTPSTRRMWGLGKKRVDTQSSGGREWPTEDIPLTFYCKTQYHSVQLDHIRAKQEITVIPSYDKQLLYRMQYA